MCLSARSCTICCIKYPICSLCLLFFVIISYVVDLFTHIRQGCFTGTAAFVWSQWLVGNKNRHDDVIKWKHFPRYWPFVWGINRSPVNSLHKGQWRRTLKFSLIYAWTNGGVNNRDAGDLRHHRAHYDVNVMYDITSLPTKTKYNKAQTLCRVGMHFAWANEH